MTLILSLICLLGFVFWIIRIYSSKFIKPRLVHFDDGSQYLLNKNMYFLIFTVCTAPFFLSTLSLWRYGLWFMTILILLMRGVVQVKNDSIIYTYYLFLFWLCCTMYYTETIGDGAMVLVKYFFPLLFLWLGYTALDNEKGFLMFLKRVNLIAMIYCVVIGGFSAKFFPEFYGTSVSALFLRCAGFADYLTAIFVVPFVLFWITGKRKYLFCALFMVLSTVMDSVRTGIGGMFLVFVFAVFFKYKFKALPAIFVAGSLFVSVILFVPEVNEKFFGEDAGTVSAGDIVYGDALAQDNINMDGRTAIWNMILERFYYKDPLLGSGIGMTGHYMKDWSKKTGAANLVHNDYIQLIADTGIVGVVLIVFFYITLFLSICRYVLPITTFRILDYSALMAGASMAGVAFSMYYNNVVSHSMTSFVIPFIFMGLYLKTRDLKYNNG